MLTTYALLVLLGAGLGVGGTAFVMRDKGDDSAETVAAAADVASETGDAVKDGINAAGAEKNKDADTRGAVVEQSPTALLAEAVIALDCPPATLAAFGYSQAVDAGMGKQEGAAAYGAPKRGEKLDEVTQALADGTICQPVVCEACPECDCPTPEVE